MSLANYCENLLLDWSLTTAVVTRPAAWYVALHNADPTEDGTVGEQTAVADTNYVRQVVTMGAAAAGQSLNTTAISYTPDGVAPAADFTVSYLSVWDASTGGNCLMYGAMQVARTINSANPLSIAIGDLVAVLD